jgi:hypothetical protein
VSEPLSEEAQQPSGQPCQTPFSAMVDLNGHLEETECGECEACYAAMDESVKDLDVENECYRSWMPQSGRQQ